MPSVTFDSNLWKGIEEEAFARLLDYQELSSSAIEQPNHGAFPYGPRFFEAASMLAQKHLARVVQIIVMYGPFPGCKNEGGLDGHVFGH